MGGKNKREKVCRNDLKYLIFPHKRRNIDMNVEYTFYLFNHASCKAWHDEAERVAGR